MQELVLQPIVQWGFLGLCGVQLVFIMWLINELLKALRANTKIIAENTAAYRENVRMTADLLKLVRAFNDKLISRPCIAQGEHRK